MIPARDRLTKLYVYDTEADMLDDLNRTEYTSGVVDGSQRFEHTFFNAFPSFGEANAAMYQCDISGTGDLTEKYIRVKYSYYATASASTRTDRWLFAGKVDKCTYDRYKTVRSLTAYDKLYELRSVDISAWWTTYWASQSTDKTYAQFVVDMCSAFGVTTDWQNLTDASGTIVYATAKNLRLAGCSFVEMLRYIGQLTRYSWFILANGKLGRSYLHNNIWQRNIDDAIDTSTTEYGDEPLPAYASVMAYDGADVIYTYGSGSPTWTIRDNPLLKGKTTSQIATELDSLRSKLAVTAGYYPLTADMIVSSPDDLNIGYDNLLNVKTTDGTLTRKHVIAGIRLWGPQLINQQIICPHEMERGDSLSPSMSAALSEIQKMGIEMTYKVNADGVIEAVNAEASDSVKIQARAININGAISANGNTKINTDGTLEAVNGKFSGELTSQTGIIGGFNLANNKIFKRSGATPQEAQYYNGVEIVSDYEPYIAVGGRTGRLTPQGEVEVVQIAQNRFGVFVERGYDDGGDAGGDFYPEYSTQLDGKYISITGGNNETYIDPTSLYIADRDILRTHQSLVGGYGTQIVANKDLNTTEFLEVRRFFCPQNVTVATLTNCPTGDAFMMEVFAPISATIDDESASSGSRYRVRIIMTWQGRIFVQNCYFGSSGWVYGGWRKVLDSLAEEGNSAFWMKAQVGRQTSIDNLTRTYSDSRVHMRMDIVSSSLSSSPFDGDGYVLTFFWDSEGMWDTQVFFPNGGGTPSIRKRRNNTSWDAAIKFVTTAVEKNAYSNTSIKRGECIARKQGNVVSINCAGDAVSIPAATVTDYVTIASKYAPSEIMYVNLANNPAQGKFAVINPNGKVQLYSSVAISSATNFAFHVTYIVD